MIFKTYSLRKSRSILKWVYSWYRKQGHKLSVDRLQQLENEMSVLDDALLKKDREGADRIARQLETFAKANCKKTIMDYAFELLFALILALVIATLVRSMWFELYEIPTGSMRPTFKEQDHLTVTKTAFGINVPLETSHFYFDPNLVQRTSVLIFSADGLPLDDTETTYFWVLPYTKRYIKRLIGKPGDSIYFYGGQLYAVDKDGNELKELRQAPWMQKLEYVPFLSFEGMLASGGMNSVYFQQFFHKLGKLTMTASGTILGDVFNGQYWIKDNPAAQKNPHDTIETYSDFYGIRNYAMARLLTKEQLLKNPDLKSFHNLDGVLFLQLNHTPSLTYPAPVIHTDSRGANIWITPYTTVIPLQQKHLDAIMDNLYTARFVIGNERGRRYSVNEKRFPPGSPSFPGVSNGTYEFYFGKLSKIHWEGITSAVSTDSPLYSRDPANVQKLFNMGIEMNLAYDAYPENQHLFPHRYAYFRDGDLYVMGVPVLKKDDPTLISFNERERKREQESTNAKPYVAFKDYGSPLKNGQIDTNFIRTFGLTIPSENYLVLGDNHAMSSDSRVFGFVPQANIQGAPSIILWPPGDRLGAPSQKPYPIFNLPRTIVWAVALAILAIWYAIYRYRISKPIFKKIESK